MSPPGLRSARLVIGVESSQERLALAFGEAADGLVLAKVDRGEQAATARLAPTVGHNEREAAENVPASGCGPLSA